MSIKIVSASLVFLLTGYISDAAFARQAISLQVSQLSRMEAKSQIISQWGMSADRRRELELQIEQLTQAISRNPNYVVAIIRRGNIRYQLGDLQGAIADYSQAIQLAPNDPFAYVNRGDVFFVSGNVQAAFEDYNAAITLQPNFANAYASRGDAFKQLGRKPEALADYQKAGQLYQMQGNQQGYAAVQAAIADL